MPKAGVGSGVLCEPDFIAGGRSRPPHRAAAIRCGMLAESTDGLAIVGTQRHRKGIQADHRRPERGPICSATTRPGKIDGRFHSIRVRVKRAGRRSARPTRLPGAERRRRARGLPKAPQARRARRRGGIWDRAAAAAVATRLPGACDQPLHVQVTAGWRPGGDGSDSQPQAGFWTVTRGRQPYSWKRNRGSADASRGSGRVGPRTNPPGAVSLLMPIDSTGARAGRPTVRVRSQTPSGVRDVDRAGYPCRPHRSASGAVYIAARTAHREQGSADRRPQVSAE